jgi:predicted DsbA family dithiol-disulfide isomerase
LSPRTRRVEPISLVLHEDPLSPWCLVAERRIAAALEDLAFAFTPLRHAPFPLRVEPRAMTKKERRDFVGSVRRAAREPEGRGITPDLWLSLDPPLTSIPALTALAAARLQGSAREAALRAALHEAALVRGLNVARADVLLELAEQVGLDLGRFAGALRAPETEKTVRAALDDALDKGIEAAPALVIGDEWLVAGARSTDEYRAILSRYATARLGLPQERTLH